MNYLLFNVGCIECGVSSNVVGVFDSREKAEAQEKICDSKFAWRQGGQNQFVIFELNLPINEINEEYKTEEKTK